ncbi:hypothetical protein K5X82_00970 [Halosquirtibacter xylanolyticus]|uniref:hypothetical protein n=1 Tax=Halosquirtibacter xylanolyticus TaxID=3374599 RepID=UPI0037484353|nr:hypothetical protein K5X82_00970 [Prolixibacteraceae bacterium]
MKKVAILIVLYISSFVCSAQSNDWSYGLSMGTSLPIGNYASSDLSNSKSGFADPGFFLDASAYYEVNSSFSWVGRVRFVNNPIDDLSAYESAVAQSYPGMALEADDEDTDFEINGWLSGAILAGAQYRWTIYNTHLDVYGMLGLQIWFLPQHELSNPNVPNRPNMTYIESSEKDQNMSLASVVGVAYSIPIKDLIYLRFNCDWSGANVKSTYSQNYVPKEVTNETPIEKVGEVSYNSYTSNINIGVGLVYQF